MDETAMFLFMVSAVLMAAVVSLATKNIRLKETVSRLDRECKSIDEALRDLMAEAKIAKETINEILPLAVAYHRVRCDRMNEEYIERSICASLAREAAIDVARQASNN